MFKLRFIKHRFNHRPKFHTINKSKIIPCFKLESIRNPRGEIYSLDILKNMQLTMKENLIKMLNVVKISN